MCTVPSDTSEEAVSNLDESGFLDIRMGGEEPWPVLADSDEPGARPTMAAVDPDEGYIPRRAQEWLLSGAPGGDARQYAAMLGAQLAAHYRA